MGNWQTNGRPRSAVLVAMLIVALFEAGAQASFTFVLAKPGKRPTARPASTQTAVPGAPALPPPRIGPVAVAVAAAPIIPAAAGKRVALVIGVGGYANVQGLENPPNDARLIAEALRRDGFIVTAVTRPEQLTRTALVGVLNRFRAQAEGAEAAVVYYAGHGVEVAGKNWLLPSDVAAESPDDLEGTAIPASYVIATVRGASKVRLVVLDACRNNPFARSRGWSTGRRAVSTGGLTNREALPDDVVLLLATRAGETSADGGRDASGNSPFARAFATTLQKEGMLIAELPTEVSAEMLAQSGVDQRPDMQGIWAIARWQFRPVAAASAIPAPVAVPSGPSPD